MVDNLGLAVDSWKIFRALGDKLKLKLNFNNHKQLLDEIFSQYPHISSINNLTATAWKKLSLEKILVNSENIDTTINNFYQTCSISRASPNMAACVKELLHKNQSN